MVSNSSYRKSFINSSIKVARLHGLQGIDFYWNYPETNSDGFNMGILLQEWRAAIDSEARNSNNWQLILTAQVKYSPSVSSISYPTEKMQQHLDWVHVVAEGYTTPLMTDLTSAHATLYDPSTFVNTDYGIREWIDRGLSANKLVLNLPFYGYSWKLENPVNNGVGAPATGPAISTDGFLTYKQIKYYIKQYAPDVRVRYNSTYVVNYWTEGTTWIGFDDVEAITAKVSYAKEKKLLGYFVWEVSFDDNWVLSRTAAGVAINDSSVHEDNKNGQNNNSSVHEDDKNGQNNKRPLLLVLFPTTDKR
ncbi:class V chitinase-like [Pistacia vera]|uniref:class V chitinase-like n=1 Tax=Pistacia vera TaxID=55513 RepID=UPI001262B92F|nr:class V chitinase-like [Pistacia vera]